MSRAVMATLVAGFVGITLALSACSGGGGHADPVAVTSPCPLLQRLAAAGQTVAHADVADPAKFDATLRTAVADYVRITRRLRAVVPSRLRPDVDRLTAAAQQYQFEQATAARANIDAYAQSRC